MMERSRHSSTPEEELLTAPTTKPLYGALLEFQAKMRKDPDLEIPNSLQYNEVLSLPALEDFLAVFYQMLPDRTRADPGYTFEDELAGRARAARIAEALERKKNLGPHIKLEVLRLTDCPVGLDGRGVGPLELGLGRRQAEECGSLP